MFRTTLIVTEKMLLPLSWISDMFSEADNPNINSTRRMGNYL
jgi:hypothetical protein